MSVVQNYLWRVRFFFFLKQIPFYLAARRKGWRSHICLPLFFLHFVVELSFSNMWGEPLCSIRRLPLPHCLSGTAINHNTEKQKFICIQLPSTFEAADLELNFFFSFASFPLLRLPPLPPAGSLLSFRKRLWSPGLPDIYLVFFFFLLFFPRGSLIQLESVQAQWILA